MPAPRASKNVIAKYLPVYFVLLGIAAVEVFLAYQHFSTGSLLAILLALAVCGGAAPARFFFTRSGEGPRVVFSPAFAPSFFSFLLFIFFCGRVCSLR